MRGDTRNTSSTDAGGNAVTTRRRTIDGRDGGGGGGGARHELRRKALHFGRGRAALGGGRGSAGGSAARQCHGVLIMRSWRLGMPCRRRQYGRQTRAPCACGTGQPTELDAAAMRCVHVAAALAISLLGCERPVDRCSPSYTIKDMLPVLMYFSFFLLYWFMMDVFTPCGAAGMLAVLCSFCSLPFFLFFFFLFCAPGELIRICKWTANELTRTRRAVHSILGWPTNVLTYELAVQETQTDQQHRHTR